MQDKLNNKSDIRIIPPVIYLIALAVAFFVNWFWPIMLLPEIVRNTAGPVLILASIAVMPSILGAFKRADTSFNVRLKPNALVTGGAFRFSRNPGYMALITLCIGISVVTDNLWVIITTAAATVYIHYVVVLAEERLLEARFGKEYLQYKNRVRRWI